MRSTALTALLVLSACGGTPTSEGIELSQPRGLGGPSEAANRSRAPLARDPETPPTPRSVVIALIRAFEAGDRARVERLRALSDRPWSDAAGFRRRAAAYRAAAFDLRPDAIEVWTTDAGAVRVTVTAERDGYEWLWTFLVSRREGALRVGPVRHSLAGRP